MPTRPGRTSRLPAPGALLDRAGFTRAVFARDARRCVICGGPAKDAHHILERKLFPDGGYRLANGASLCGPHHLAAEMTTLSCDEIRQAAGISLAVLPPGFDPAKAYDKWGNVVLADGTRHKGPLFDDDGQRTILARAGLLRLFRDPSSATTP